MRQIKVRHLLLQQLLLRKLFKTEILLEIFESVTTFLLSIYGSTALCWTLAALEYYAV
jgi:hypothetical protein